MYLVIKALHIICVISWFAGLFYIFRLFVYHRQNLENQEICQLLNKMQSRLFHVIIIPASFLSISAGIALLYLNPAFAGQTWLWLKLLLVVALFLYQVFAFIVMQRFAQRDFFITERQCRLINEVPTVLLFGIVFLVVLKPFL